jgi:hypothetical protein
MIQTPDGRIVPDKEPPKMDDGEYEEEHWPDT